MARCGSHGDCDSGDGGVVWNGLLGLSAREQQQQQQQHPLERWIEAGEVAGDQSAEDELSGRRFLQTPVTDLQERQGTCVNLPVSVRLSSCLSVCVFVCTWF